MKEKPTHYAPHTIQNNMQHTIQTQPAPSSATPNHSTPQAAPKPAFREYLCLERQSQCKKTLEF